MRVLLFIYLLAFVLIFLFVIELAKQQREIEELRDELGRAKRALKRLQDWQRGDSAQGIGGGQIMKPPTSLDHSPALGGALSKLGGSGGPGRGGKARGRAARSLWFSSRFK